MPSTDHDQLLADAAHDLLEALQGMVWAYENLANTDGAKQNMSHTGTYTAGQWLGTAMETPSIKAKSAICKALGVASTLKPIPTDGYQIRKSVCLNMSIAAHTLLGNLLNDGTHGPDIDDPEAVDCHKDEDGDPWYPDAWDLKQAVEDLDKACNLNQPEK